MNLAQALKQKSRLAKEIKTLQEAMNKWNSVFVGAERGIDIASAYQEVIEKSEKLAQLKAQIHIANAPIMEKIFLISEYKGTSAFLSRLNTASGPVSLGYGANTAEATAAMSGADVHQELATLREKIDRLQDEIDTFNALTIV